MKYCFYLLIFSLIPFLSRAQKADFLPKRNLWQTQTLDPIASQSYGQVDAVWEDGIPADYVLTIFAFGFQKSAFAWKFSEDLRLDVGLECAAFTQFEFTNRGNEFQRNIISTDYLIGLPIVLKVKAWTLRLRLYHLSAHMAEDYIIKNGIDEFAYHNNKYEQVDFTAAYQISNFRIYLGIGATFRANTARRPMVFTYGLEYLLALNQKESTHFYAGFYADSKEELGYSPAVNAGLGVQLGKPDRRPIKFLITYYYGPLPYSVFYGNQIQWLGIGLYINPF